MPEHDLTDPGPDTEPDEPEHDFTDPALYRRPVEECDLVMKGGITSGVVYPLAACRLAMRYRFRSIGGSSAGAVAAGGVAAAEHGRGGGGFARLAKVPDDLGGQLDQLFQPSAGTKAAYGLLSAWLEPAWGPGRKVAATLAAVVRETWAVFALALAVLLLPPFVVAVVSQGPPADVQDWLDVGRALLVWLPAALVLALVPAAAVLARRTLRALPANGYGLCVGHAAGPDAGKPLPLTDWLCDLMDELAGVQGRSWPLTFGDLWGEDAVALEAGIAERDDRRQQVPAADRRRAQAARSVDLQVITTSLTFRRPYRFPFDTRLFHFCEQRLRAYFPHRVVDHMVATSAQVADQDGGDGQTVSMLCPCHGERVRSLPRAYDLPVVLAVRLSLSFPVLISAVPLFAVAWWRGAGHRRLVEAWFSDGGITSNFPMHLFDALWPRRPTFGLNLTPPHPDYPDQAVWRPPVTVRQSGISLRSYPVGSMPGFFAAILDTMQNWVDTTQLVLPGYRDRVAQVRLQPSEGGMNLKMPAETITKVASYGAAAAALFDDFDPDLHRWIRYRVAMSEIDGVLGDLQDRYDDGYEAFVADYGPAPGGYEHGSAAATEQDREATAGLMDVAGAWDAAGHPSSAGRVPRPKPLLRIVPRQ